jgi:hypothetical protein
LKSLVLMIALKIGVTGVGWRTTMAYRPIKMK